MQHTCHKQWYKHSPIPSIIDGNITITWDLKIVVDKKLEHNCLDIVVIDKDTCTTQIIGIVVPFDTNVVDKTAEKITKYRDLEIALKKNWDVKKIQTISIVVGSFGTVCTSFWHYLSKVSTFIRPELVQKTAVLGTAHMLRHVLIDLTN
eukprot:5669297-Ditylum_brightwellii.AAC.1